MDLKILKKRPDENDEQYIYRVCELKEENGMTWQQIADVLNESLGQNFCESKYRKAYQQFNKMLEANEDKIFTDDEYLKKIQAEKMDLEKERQKLYATKVEMQRVVRQNSRFELFYENVRDAISALPMPMIKYTDNKRFLLGKEYLLTIADIHCGAQFDLPTNSYSIEECERRFGVLLNDIADYVQRNQISRLNVVSLSDDIQGVLRVSDLQLNETSVVEATVVVSRLIANFLNELSAFCSIEYYHAPNSNHSQIRPIGTKASELATEDLEYIIGNYITDLLRNNTRVHVHTNFGCDYIEIPIFDYNIIALHGHTIKNYETALKDLSALHRKMYDFVIVGHMHNAKQISGNENGGYDTEVLMCPSFQGTDPFAFNKLGKSAKAACKMFIFDAVYGCTGTEKFILN